MIATIDMFRKKRWLTIAVVAAGLGLAAPAPAQDVAASDILNATLWMQKSIEYKANSLAIFALAKIRLDQLLADKKHTAAPNEQKGDFANLPPALVIDGDETLLDNSGYQAWMVKAGTTFSPKTWTQYVNAMETLAIPGAVEFCKYADSKGVKLFYVSNRTNEEKPASKKNMEKLGFPMGGNVETFLFAKDQPDWGSAKSTRRAFIAKDYRIVMLLGDNYGDFSDGYKGSEADRQKEFEANKDRWGRDWIMLANPAYGSFESAPFMHDYKKSQTEQRKAKHDALKAWSGPKP
ncbi:MAG: 5'-nucleotidase, lipoprotein e(P4) family [Rhodospirillales bacterium]